MLFNQCQEGLAPIHLVVENEFPRATPGGTGGVKFIGNYASVSRSCNTSFLNIELCQCILDFVD